MKAFMLPFFILLSLILCNCNLFKNLETQPQMPPITQTGANTYGCMYNGKLWLPGGYNGTSNYQVSYDKSYAGSFDISTYRYGDSDNDQQYIYIFIRGLYQTGTYYLKNKGNLAIVLRDRKPRCFYDSTDSLQFASGYVTITKLDMGIISGTFEFTLAKQGCDTIKVTNGRFDKKL